MSEKLAVIFGGSGFVGRNVVRVLAQQGWRVRVAVRRPHHAGFLRPMGVVGQVSLAQVNVRHQPSVTEAMRGADAVVNLVGILHQEGAQKFNAVHVDGARAIASAAAEAGVSRFVQMSAITADENSESAYARSKARGERAVRECSRVPPSCARRSFLGLRMISSIALHKWQPSRQRYRSLAAARQKCNPSMCVMWRRQCWPRWKVMFLLVMNMRWAGRVPTRSVS